MSLNVNPSGIWLYRQSNSLFIGGGGNPGDEAYGLGPYQHYVDFDLLGPKFKVVMGGQLGSSPYSAPGATWYIRIGGTEAISALIDPFRVIDGDRVTIGTTGAIAAFGNWVLESGEVDNIWTGPMLVKLTGSAPGGASSSLRPTLCFYPVPVVL